MSFALKAVAWAWRFTEAVKPLAGFQGTGQLQLPGPLEPSELQLPGVQKFVLILIWELSISYFCRF